MGRCEDVGPKAEPPWRGRAKGQGAQRQWPHRYSSRTGSADGKLALFVSSSMSPREEPKSCWQPPWWAGGPLSGLWLDGPLVADGESNREGAQHLGNQRGPPGQGGGNRQDLPAWTPRGSLEVHEEAQINCKTERKPLVFCAIFRVACEIASMLYVIVNPMSSCGTNTSEKNLRFGVILLLNCQNVSCEGRNVFPVTR